MFPTLIEVDSAAGHQAANTYGVFIVLAFCAAYLYVHVHALRAGVNPDRLVPGYVSAAVGGLIGARILYALSVDWKETLANPLSLLGCAGFAFYGGVIGGAIGVILFIVASKLPVWRLADVAGPAVVLGLGVGRIGCFFAGCCHGAVAPVGANPVGLLPAAFPGGQIWLSSAAPFLTTEFHLGVGRIHDVPLYPTQLWSAVTGLTLATFLAAMWRRRTFDGQIAALTLLVEPPFRMAIESFRADQRGYVVQFPVSEATAAWFPPGMASAGAEVGAHVVGITTSQGIGLALMALGVTIWFLRRSSGLERTTAVQTTDGDLLEELA